MLEVIESFVYPKIEHEGGTGVLFFLEIGFGIFFQETGLKKMSRGIGEISIDEHVIAAYFFSAFQLHPLYQPPFGEYPLHLCPFDNPTTFFFNDFRHGVGA